jgi:hypothetical protein
MYRIERITDVEHDPCEPTSCLGEYFYPRNVEPATYVIRPSPALKVGQVTQFEWEGVWVPAKIVAFELKQDGSLTYHMESLDFRIRTFIPENEAVVLCTHILK